MASPLTFTTPLRRFVVDGEIIAAAQEERFTRIRHDPSFPANAIEYCLRQGDLEIEQLDHVVFYEKPILKFERLLETYLSFAPRGYTSFLAAMPSWLRSKLYLSRRIRQQPSLIAEFVEFFFQNKKWWLTPIIILLILGLFMVLTNTAAGPFIYVFF